MQVSDEDRKQYISTLRKIADIAEKNPDIQVPYLGSIIISARSKQELIDLAKTYGGKWDKHYTDHEFNLTQQLAKSICLYMYIEKEKICKKIVTGKKIVPKFVIPATEERVIPEHEEDIVEWYCPDSIME